MGWSLSKDAEEEVNAFIAGVLLGATMIIAVFTLDGAAVAVMLACLLIAFGAGLVASAYSDWEVRHK